jgi:prepilin-type N-terminal cleavage/methylation domain-containing protein
MKINYKNQGFTIVESLVAISILTVSILATYTAVQGSLKSSNVAKDKITAFYLAQEAVEFIKNLKDENSLHDTYCISTGLCSTVNWLHGLSETTGDSCWYGGGGVSQKTCTVDIFTKNISQCAGGAGTCSNLNQNSTTGAFSYTSGAGWVASNFKREVQISPISSKEVEIVVTMSWNTGGLAKSFQIKESLFNGQ